MSAANERRKASLSKTFLHRLSANNSALTDFDINLADVEPEFTSAPDTSSASFHLCFG